MMDAAVPCTRDEENTHATGKVSLAAKSPPGRLENLLRQDGNVPEFKSDNRALFLRTPTKSPLDISQISFSFQKWGNEAFNTKLTHDHLVIFLFLFFF